MGSSRPNSAQKGNQADNAIVTYWADDPKNNSHQEDHAKQKRMTLEYTNKYIYSHLL